MQTHLIYTNLQYLSEMTKKGITNYKWDVTTGTTTACTNIYFLFTNQHENQDFFFQMNKQLALYHCNL